MGELNTYAHNIARQYNKEVYGDAYQQAWLFILEAQEAGKEGNDLFWEARYRTNLWANYTNRLVALPARTGSKDLAESQEVDNEIQDYTFSIKDHTEAYELSNEVDYLKLNVTYLPQGDQDLLKDVYHKGMSFRDMAKKYGGTHAKWQKRHTEILSKLKSLQGNK